MYATGRMPRPKGRAPFRVFVAENDGLVRDACVDRLAGFGMAVGRSARPDGLVQALRAFQPDVVLLGERFRRSGIVYAELMPRLVERFPGVRYVVSLGVGPAGDAGEPFRWGASDVVHRATMFRERRLEGAVLRAARG